MPTLTYRNLITVAENNSEKLFFTKIHCGNDTNLVHRRKSSCHLTMSMANKMCLVTVTIFLQIGPKFMRYIGRKPTYPDKARFIG